jgi:hypothetical protein
VLGVRRVISLAYEQVPFLFDRGAKMSIYAAVRRE